MKCYNCNKDLPINSRFCTNCGAKVEELPKSNTSSENITIKENNEVKKNTSVKFIIPIVILGVIILAASILLISKNNSKNVALKAFQLTEEHKYDEAIKIYNKILNKDPENLDIYLELLNLYNVMGESELQKNILQRGIDDVEDNAILKLELGNYYIDHYIYIEGERLFLQVLENDDNNLLAYESLIEIYDELYEDDKSINLYKKYSDKIDSEKATILVANSYFNMGEMEEGKRLIATIDIAKVEDSKTLENLVKSYLRLGDEDKAILVANKGLKTDEPSIFHGISYGLTNEKKLKLITMETGDINGDRKKENILLMSDSDKGNFAEVIEIFIQEGSTGKIMEIISLSDIAGYPSRLDLADLNHDGILDILASVHSGGTAGFEFHYGYSYKDNSKMDILDTLVYDINFRFSDGYRAEIFSEEISKAYVVEFQGEQKERYKDEGYYTSNGMLLNSMYGYFRGDSLEVSLIEELNQYGLKNHTSLIGPSYNADEIAQIETTYLFKDGKWKVYDLIVEDNNNIVSSIDFKNNNKETIFEKDFKRLDEMFSMTLDDIYRKHGTPIETGWWTGSEYMLYEDITYFVYDNKVTVISIADGDELFGIKFKARNNEIKAALGKPEFEGLDSDEGGEIADGYYINYTIGKYYMSFYSPSQDGRYSLMIYNK